MKKLGSLLALTALSVPQFAIAQSLHDFENAGRTEMRAMAGVTIPLGDSRKSHETKPRVDFSVESARIGQNSSFDHNYRSKPVVGWQPDRKSTLSFTLEQQPTMMLNGQRLRPTGQR